MRSNRRLLKSASPGNAISPPVPEDQYDRSTWLDLRAYFASTFLSKTRDEWEAVFLGSDACVAPVLEASEVREDVPAVAPALSRSPAMARPAEQAVRDQFLASGADTENILKQELGFSDQDISDLCKEGVVSISPQARHAKL